MDQEEVVRNLRSCLISSKGGIRLDNLQADYRMVAGEPLPFKQFGYPSVEVFIHNIPDVTVTKKNGELYVEAVPSESTAHLTKLVSRQKTRRKIPQSKKIPSRYSTRGPLPGSFKNGSFQSNKNNYVNSTSSFTRSTPGKSNLYRDFSRPVSLVDTTVQCSLSCNNGELEKNPKCAPVASKRLKDKLNPTIHQSVTCKNDSVKYQVLEEKSTVINFKPKTAESKSIKLSERLKTFSLNTPTSLLNHNNDHTSSQIPSLLDIPQITPSFKASDPRKELQNRANELNLSPPTYKMYSKKEKHSAKITIYASVKVGVHTFHTFPEDAASEEDAQKIAARLALVNLAKESSSPEVTTVDVQLVKERILSIITRHRSGVFMHLLPRYYEEQYGEALPSDWRKIIEQCADISQEKGVGDSMILCRSCPNAKRPENQGRTAFNKDILENNSNTSSDKIQLSPIGPAAPDKLEVPVTTIWNVYTTCVISTTEVWIRLIDDDYNDNFVDMTNEMTKYYNKIKKSAMPTMGCIIGDFYAILEEDYWHRVQCIDVDSDTGIATVFFIDEGYEEQYKPDALYSLDKKFCTLPAQAIKVALQGLEDFCDYPHAVGEIESQLFGDRVFLVKVNATDIDKYGSCATVTFYDTSGDDDIDINKVLFNKILNGIMDASIVHVGQLIELYVTHIDKNGKVFAQLNCFGRDLLMSHMSVNNTIYSSVTDQISFTTMYLVKYDSQLYRARVIDIPDQKKVTTFLVDIGRTITIWKYDLLHINAISMVLQCIPPQATQIFLHQIDQSMYDERFVTRFRELVSDTDLLLAKILKISASGIPMVQIFKRVGPNNLLGCINTSLIYELAKPNEDSNNNVKSKKRLERRNPRALPPETVSKLNPPMIPDKYFDVHVTLAAHPGHFIVQPLINAKELKIMMTRLQKTCETFTGPPLESIGEGKLYAGKFRDDWYRVYVTDIISDNEVSVYFCDYGDVTIVSRYCLQPLQSNFLKLPYQAVKAKLVGIEPVNTDWSVGDCVRFKDLVLDKDFVSVVTESVFDNFSPANGTVLGLQLIDVSTDKDIYINKLLVEEKRAKYIDGFEEDSSSS
ncbi:hypothetical protein HN011_002636 [Eciton burchellii]|nr:hypothetical protein HN011_002636 [Eciton burchellii]